MKTKYLFNKDKNIFLNKFYLLPTILLELRWHELVPYSNELKPHLK